MIPRGIAFDNETHLIRPGVQAPAAVCTSWVEINNDHISRPYIVGGLNGKEAIVNQYLGWCRTPGLVLYGANTAYDCLTICSLAADLRGYDYSQEVLCETFTKYRKNEITDILTRQKMLDLSAGCYRGYVGEKGKWVHYGYNLDDLQHRWTGKRLNKKEEHDSPRLRYGEVANIPIEQWPKQFLDYSYEDAVSTGTVAIIQEQIPDRTSQNFPGYDPLADQYNQARAAFWLKLCSVWGIRTNAQAVDIFSREVAAEFLWTAEELCGDGLAWKEYKLDRKKLVERIGKLGKMPLITVQGESGESKLRLAADTLLSVNDPIVSLAAIWQQIRRGLDAGDPKAHEAFKMLEHAGVAEMVYHRSTKVAADRMIRVCMSMNREVKLTDGGGVALDKETCDSTGDPMLQQYAELSSLGKTMSNDIPALRSGAYFPIHTRFEELLDTGRTSSSGPNIQNIRRRIGIRECFIPRGGCLIVDADYKMLELHTLAQICIWKLGYSALGKALNAGEDPHLRVGATMLSLPYPEALRRYEAGDGTVSNGRDCGKVGNFGIPGGLGAETLVMYAAKSYGVKITLDVAKDIKSNFLSTWIEMPQYFAMVSEWETFADSGSYNVVQPWSNRLRADATFCAACNSGFQGLGADVAKLAGWYLAEAMYTNPRDALFGCRMINFVHDQFLVEAREDIASDAAKSLKHHMDRAALEILPDCPTKANVLLSRVWSKKAKRTEVNGVLVPWEPKESAA